MLLESAQAHYKRLVAYHKFGQKPNNKNQSKYLDNTKHDWRFNVEQNRLEARITRKGMKSQVLPQFANLHPSALTKEHIYQVQVSEFFWVWAPEPG